MNDRLECSQSRVTAAQAVRAFNQAIGITCGAGSAREWGNEGKTCGKKAHAETSEPISGNQIKGSTSGTGTERWAERTSVEPQKGPPLTLPSVTSQQRNEMPKSNNAGKATQNCLAKRA